MTGLDRKCRICGCTDLQACRHDDGTPCAWFDDDLCSLCDEKLPEVTAKLLAAASSLATAAADCIEMARDPGRALAGANMMDVEPATIVLDALRLMLEATGQTDGALYAAVARELVP